MATAHPSNGPIPEEVRRLSLQDFASLRSRSVELGINAGRDVSWIVSQIGDCAGYIRVIMNERQRFRCVVTFLAEDEAVSFTVDIERTAWRSLPIVKGRSAEQLVRRLLDLVPLTGWGPATMQSAPNGTTD